MDNKVIEEELKQLAQLKEEFLVHHRRAEQAAYKYFCACPLGQEREKAGEVYDKVRTALRTGG